MISHSDSYRDSGVDITAGYKAVELMKSHVKKTMTSGVVSGIGGFGGLFRPDIKDMTSPILVSGTDGVGTKLKIAFLTGVHNTVGIDCVAMCVNDVVCSGAKPLFFLDYIALGKNIPEKVADIVSGVAEGCVQSGCALIGGETAEMPGFYAENEYDLAGFCVGLVDQPRILDRENVKPGDVIIALKSSGLHSNGFSLVRKAFDVDNINLDAYIDEIGSTIGQALLTPTKIYVKTVLSLIDKVNVKSIAHITGGGFYENIPRALPEGTTAKIEKKSIIVPPIFSLVQKAGEIPERDMFNTFNMGVGMVVIIDRDDCDKALEIIGDEGYVIGSVARGQERVELV